MDARLACETAWSMRIEGAIAVLLTTLSFSGPARAKCETARPSAVEGVSAGSLRVGTTPP